MLYGKPVRQGEQPLTHSPATEDEAIQWEYGHDLAQLQIVQERIEAAACKEFGELVKEFRRETLV